MRKKYIREYVIVMVMIILCCCGCSLPTSKTADASDDGTGFIKSGVGYYDSKDTAVLVKKNEEDSTITLLNIKVGRNYTLKYDGATQIEDKHKQALSMSQVMPGDIVDVTFVKQSKRLNSIRQSSESWSYGAVEKYSFGRNNQTMAIGDEEYELYDNVPVISNNTEGELMDLNAQDILTVQGIDHTVYSITVDKGHGYLRLDNDQYFIGGWIEVGQKVIQPITEGMLLVVPEGTYQVLLTNTRIQGTKEVTIDRDGEVALDVGDIKPEEAKYGTILFSINPSDTTLYIDGNQQDYDKPVTLEYGIHQMIAKAEGYKTVTQYIKVGQETATISVELEAQSEEDKDADMDGDADTENSTEENEDSMIEGNSMSSNNTVTAASPAPYLNTTASASSTTKKVYIDSPEGAELYLDSNYIGIVPVAFSKSPGTHIVSLRKTGYQTKSYTLQIDAEDKDITYSFAELVHSAGIGLNTEIEYPFGT
ncbi:MAG: PEGA domain-containing protein [Lachnospiraceae bacterium]|nr:PEGA domain-containing protein [Lachnospiraceae bacterium]